jgi:hypothetical protein
MGSSRRSVRRNQEEHVEEEEPQHKREIMGCYAKPAPVSTYSIVIPDFPLLCALCESASLATSLA